MVVERIERKDGWWSFMYGFGRIQRARHIFTKNLPESIQRAIIANPDIDMKELMTKTSPDVITEMNERIGKEIVALVLHGAHDWDKEKVSAEDYVDGSLPEDIGNEIVSRMRDVVNRVSLSDDQKKD